MILKDEKIKSVGKLYGNLILERYDSSSEGIYSIKYYANEGYELSNNLCQEMNLKYYQYRENLKKKEQTLYGYAAPHIATFEVKSRSYDDFYNYVRDKLMKHYNIKK